MISSRPKTSPTLSAARWLPFLSCFDLAVFKAFFDRTKDWADLEEMARAGTFERERVQATLIGYLGADDARIAKLSALRGSPPPSGRSSAAPKAP